MAGLCGLYAGSFDPITLGHYDVILRTSRLFDQVVVAVAQNTSKAYLLSPEERLALVQEVVAPLPNVQVQALPAGLTVTLAQDVGAQVLIRGIRNEADFTYEASMAWLNRTQAPELETVFFCPQEKYQYLSSSLVREIARHGGDLAGLVPKAVLKALKAKF